MELINLTPWTIELRDPVLPVIRVIPPSGKVASTEEYMVPGRDLDGLATWDVYHDGWLRIPEIAEDSWAEQPAVIYLVTAQVRRAMDVPPLHGVRRRRDIASLHDPCFSGDGKRAAAPGIDR